MLIRPSKLKFRIEKLYFALIFSILYIDSTLVFAQSSHSILGRWDNIGLSTNNLISYRVFQKDGQVFGRYDLVDNNGNRTGGGQKYVAKYKINSNGVIRIFNQLKESCILIKSNEMQCYSDNERLGDLGYYKKGRFKSELHQCLIYLHRIPHSGYDSAMPKALRSRAQSCRVRSLMQLLPLQRSIFGNAPCTLIETVSLSRVGWVDRNKTGAKIAQFA
jgi:hypothetical protein